MRMSFVRCQACGAKALMAASQCPRCSEPLLLRDDYGKDLPLSRCRSCDTYYPSSAGSCRWCGTTAPRARAPWLVAATLVAVVASGAWAAVTYFDIRVASPVQAIDAGSVAIPAPPVQSRAISNTPQVASAARTTAAEEPSTASRPAATAAARRFVDSSSAAPTPRPLTTKPPMPLAAAPAASSVPSSPPPVPVATSTEWVDAVSTTWVNVRGHPSRDSAVVAVIQPESRVRLAQSRSAWTRVTARGASGWVDRRLFAVDSVRPPH